MPSVGWACYFGVGIWITANEWTACHITSELILGCFGSFYHPIQGLEQPRDSEAQLEIKERPLRSSDPPAHFNSSLVARLDKVLRRGVVVHTISFDSYINVLFEPPNFP